MSYGKIGVPDETRKSTEDMINIGWKKMGNFLDSLTQSLQEYGLHGEVELKLVFTNKDSHDGKLAGVFERNIKITID